MRIKYAVALCLAMIPAFGIAQQEQLPATVDFVVDEPRPLWAAVTKLHKQFGWTITYEDAPFAFSNDRKTLPGTGRPGGPPTEIPRGGTFPFAMTSSMSPSGLASEVLGVLVQRYNESPIAAGRFKVAQDNQIFHVLPEAYRTASGELRPYASSLETTIDVPAGTTTLLDALDGLAKAVSAASGREVLFAQIPHGLALQKVALRGGRMSGRAALVEILGQTMVKTTTALLCNPGEPARCFLNLTQVKATPGASH